MGKIMTTEPKPVLPHYSPTRRALWNAASKLRTDAQEEERGMEYHHNALRTAKAKIARMTEEADAIEKAARALGGMDKSGIVVEPTTEPVPPPPSPKVCI